VTRAMTFGTSADAYDRLRPAPAPEALDHVLPPGARRVADLAAGTGLVTRAILARPGAPAVVAVEPDPRMLARLSATTPGALAVRGVAEAIPLASGAVDAVLASSAWHWFDPPVATAEIARVLRPGGTLAVTVPAWLPERICWALSREYHEVPGGHVRIFTRAELTAKLTAAGLTPAGSHHAHGLHSAYWWLKCAVGVHDDTHPAVRAYHRLLVWDMMQRPWLTQTAERLLNPVLGKSVVVYLRKP
jgi:SAM-dependent methyltransferase